MFDGRRDHCPVASTRRGPAYFHSVFLRVAKGDVDVFAFEAVVHGDPEVAC